MEWEECACDGSPNSSSVQAAALVAVLLSTFTQMAGNAHISKRIIAGLRSHSRGCQILRLATKKWQSQSSGYSMHDSAANASIQWAIARLWQLGTIPQHRWPQSSNPSFELTSNLIRTSLGADGFASQVTAQEDISSRLTRDWRGSA